MKAAQRRVIGFGGFVLTLVGAGLYAQTRRVTLGERNDNYHLYRMDTNGGVRLVRELSRNACQQNRTWGVKREGIWTDRGCRAEFEIGRENGTGNGSDYGNRVPDWAVGTFTGHSRKYNTDVTLTIGRNGGAFAQATTREGQTNRDAGHWRNGKLTLARANYLLTRAGNGFDAVQVEDRGNRVSYRRNGNDNRPNPNPPPINFDPPAPSRLPNGTFLPPGSNTVPNWLSGTFLGHNRKYNVDIEITLDGRGNGTARVTDKAGKQSVQPVTYTGGKLKIGPDYYLVNASGKGFQTTQEADRGNRMEYSRR